MYHTVKKINGIDCVFIPLKDSTSTTIQILVKAGSIYENEQNNGISHFLEHMFFKGSPKYPTAKIQSQSIEKFGGEVNAFTSNEYAGYYIKSAPEFVEKSLDILSDMILHPFFPEKELEKEKGVVLQEIMMYQDNPARLVGDLADLYFLGNNGYGRPVLGTAENVQAIRIQDLEHHKNGLYTKDNMVIVISGNITQQEELEEQIASLFVDLPENRTIEATKFDWIAPQKHEEKYQKGTEQNHLVISAMGFDGNQNERYAGKILGCILGGNMSSRLFQEIREKEGLCYYINASHSAHVGYGNFIIRAGIQKDKFAFGKEKIYQELEKISTGDVAQEEFNDVMGFLRGTIQMSMETSDEIGYIMGLEQLLYGKIDTIPELLDAYASVTLDEVNSVARKLSKEHLFGYWIE